MYCVFPPRWNTPKGGLRTWSWPESILRRHSSWTTETWGPCLASIWWVMTCAEAKEKQTPPLLLLAHWGSARGAKLSYASEIAGHCWLRPRSCFSPWKSPDPLHFRNVALQTFCMAICMAIFMFMTKINKLPAIKKWKRAGRRPVQRGPAARLRTYLRWISLSSAYLFKQEVVH